MVMSFVWPWMITDLKLVRQFDAFRKSTRFTRDQMNGQQLLIALMHIEMIRFVCTKLKQKQHTHTHKKKQPKRNKSGSLSQSVFHYSLRFFGGIITSTCGPPPLFSTNYFNLLFIIRTHLLIEIPLGHGSQTCTMSIECKCQNTRLSC